MTEPFDIQPHFYHSRLPDEYYYTALGQDSPDSLLIPQGKENHYFPIRVRPDLWSTRKGITIVINPTKVGIINNNNNNRTTTTGEHRSNNNNNKQLSAQPRGIISELPQRQREYTVESIIQNESYYQKQKMRKENLEKQQNNALVSMPPDLKKMMSQPIDVSPKRPVAKSVKFLKNLRTKRWNKLQADIDESELHINSLASDVSPNNILNFTVLGKEHTQTFHKLMNNNNNNSLDDHLASRTDSRQLNACDELLQNGFINGLSSTRQTNKDKLL